MIRRGEYTIPEATIHEAMAAGATHYDSREYDWYFTVLRPHFRRRWLLWGPREFKCWESLRYYATPGYGAGGIVWVAPYGWEQLIGERTPPRGAMIALEGAAQ